MAPATTREATSRRQRNSRRIVRLLASAGLGLAAALVLLGWLWNGWPLLDSLLLGMALTMAILPEEIPVVLTVLAVDKTGTLPLNGMEVAQLWVPDQNFHEDDGAVQAEDFHPLAEFAGCFERTAAPGGRRRSPATRGCRACCWPRPPCGMLCCARTAAALQSWRSA